MKPQSAVSSAWPRAKLPIALSRVSYRGVFSQLKRCRVRNTASNQQTCVGVELLRTCCGGSLANQRRGGARFYSSALPGSGWLVDAITRATSWSNTDTRVMRMTVTPTVS